MFNYTEADIRSGRAPYCLWHFVNSKSVTWFKVNNRRLTALYNMPPGPRLQSATYNAVAAVEAAKAINRMMGRDPMYGWE